MKTCTKSLLLGLLGCSAVVAQEEVIESPPVLSPGEQKVTETLAGDFEEFAGDDALPLVEALRNGSDLSYDVEREVQTEVPVVDAEGNPVYVLEIDGSQVLDADGNPVQATEFRTETITETIVVENTAGEQGFGNVKITMLLAEELLAREGLDGTVENVSGALFGSDPALADGILEMRADGAGWGEISKELLNTSVGSLMSRKNTADTPSNAKRDSRPKEATKAAPAGKPEKLPKASKPATRERPARSARTEKPARPAKATKVDRPSKPQRPVKVDRPAKPERPSKPERPIKPDRPEKPARPDRPGR